MKYNIAFFLIFGILCGLFYHLVNLQLEWSVLISFSCCSILFYFYRTVKPSFYSIFSALLISFSLPGFDYGFLSFISLLPLFFLLQEDLSYKGLFFYGALTGIILQTIVFSWMYQTIINFTQFPSYYAIPIFIIYLFLFSLKFPLMLLILKWIENNLRLSRFLIYPVVITLCDFFIYELFPWYLGNSQHQNIYFIQFIEYTGVVGLTFMIALINVLVYELILFFTKKRAYPITGFAVTTFLVLAVYIFGYIRVVQIGKIQQTTKPILVGIVQPNNTIGSTDYKSILQLLENLKKTSENIIKDHKIDLLVWPESSPLIVYQRERKDGLFSFLIDRLTKDNQIHLFFGSTTTGIIKSEHNQIFNTAVLLSPEINILGSYRKQILFPFGEYKPFWNFLESLYQFFGYANPGYFPGKIIEVFPFPKAKLAPQICYEIIHPSFTRKFINQGGEVIINISNDSWFGKSKASEQHLAVALFRAVENKVPLVRATNTGTSVFISPTGELDSKKTPLYEVASLVQEIHPPKIKTFYTRFGDWFPYLILGFFLFYSVFYRNK